MAHGTSTSTGPGGIGLPLLPSMTRLMPLAGGSPLPFMAPPMLAAFGGDKLLAPGPGMLLWRFSPCAPLVHSPG